MATKCFPLTLSKKMEIIIAVEKNEKSKTLTKTRIAENFQIPKTTLSTILRNKSKITEAFEQSQFDPDRKRLRTAMYEDLEEVLLKWIGQARSLNMPLGGPIILEKANNFAQKLGYSTFKCSTGWLERFKVRYNITFKKICGESGKVTSEMTAEWTSTILPSLLSQFSPDDVYNGDETGLFYKCLPDKTFLMKGETCNGGKQSKERLTVLVAVNMSGKEKLPLLVIGKYLKPRCFKGVQTIPVQYEANKKAWMLSHIFTSWLTKLDKKFMQEGRKVAMIVDNCPSHPNIQSQLNATKLVFLPPNTTSKLQPCDQGIIQNLKVHYRHMLLQKMVFAVDNKEQFSVNVLEALRILKSAWCKVTPQTIVNCFRHAGFLVPNVDEEFEIEVREGGSDSGIQKEEILRILPQGVTFADYLSVDDGIIPTGVMTDDDIVEAFTNAGGEPTLDEFEEDDTPFPLEVPTSCEALKALKLVQRYFESQKHSEDSLDLVRQLEDNLTSLLIESKRQSSITDFFPD